VLIVLFTPDNFQIVSPQRERLGRIILAPVFICGP
jgi:hypothetical protein